MRHDLRLALRRLGATPIFAVAAVLVLAVGIAVPTVLVSVMNGLLMSTQGVKAPHELLRVSWHSRQNPTYRAGFTYGEYASLQDFRNVLERTLAHHPFRRPITIGAEARIVVGEFVSDSYFEALGVRAEIGRVFGPVDSSSAEPIVVISHRLFRTALGGDTSAIGSSVRIGPNSFTVVGVADRAFAGLTMPGIVQVDAWVPLRMARVASHDASSVDPASRVLEVYARPNERVLPTYWAGAAAGIEGALREADAAIPDELALEIRPLGHTGLGESAKAGSVAAVAALVLVSIVMLIACANLGGLLLTRGLARSNEVAVRIAIGATRLHLVRQFMFEPLVIALAAAVLSILVAQAVVAFAEHLMPAATVGGIALEIRPTVDVGVAAATLILGIVAAAVCGILPALRVSRPDIRSGLTGEIATSEGSTRLFTLRNGLVCFQIAASTGLLILGFVSMGGFFSTSSAVGTVDEQDVALSEVELSLHYQDVEQRHEFVRRLRSQVKHVDPAARLGFGSQLPMNAPAQALVPEGWTESVRASVIAADAGFLRLMGLPILQGREFQSSDEEVPHGAVLVSRSFAERYWAGQSPISKRISFGQQDGAFEVVGVIADVSDAAHDLAAVYVPLASRALNRILIVSEGAGSVVHAAGVHRAAVRAVDENVALVENTSLRAYLERAALPYKSTATVVLALATVALALALCGVQGTVQYLVSQQKREFGIRMAMGATSWAITSMVLWLMLRVVVLGVASGVILGIGLSRALQAWAGGAFLMTWGSLTAPPLLLVVVVLVTGFFPARSASRLDPLVTLKSL
jgi:predicted permease